MCACVCVYVRVRVRVCMSACMCVRACACAGGIILTITGNLGSVLLIMSLDGWLCLCFGLEVSVER